MTLVLFIFMGVVTYATRSVVFLIDLEISPKFKTFLQYIPFCILKGIWRFHNIYLCHFSDRKATFVLNKVRD